MSVIADLQLTVKPTTALYTNIIADADFTVSESAVEGRKGIVLDFGDTPGLYARDLGTIFEWPLQSDTVLYVWQPSLIPQPESIYGRPTDWLGAETPGAKFIQGVLISANSFNVAKTFQLQSGDDLSLVSLLETPATFNQQSQKAFSCVPFVAHTARIVSADGIPWQLFGAELVYEPYPEETRNWTTEFISFGVGYQHIRMLNVPYIAQAAVTVTLHFDQWPDIVISGQLPATATLSKPKINVPANKGKLVSFSFTSSAPFRIFKPWVEVWVGAWGRQDAYQKTQPFGGSASDGAVV
jgi:hypothetical protein